MRIVISAVLWLGFTALLEAAPISPEGLLATPDNFEMCEKIHGMMVSPVSSELSPMTPADGFWGSFAGLIDYVETDRILSFIDDYVANQLQAMDVPRAVLQIALSDLPRMATLTVENSAVTIGLVIVDSEPSE